MTAAIIGLAVAAIALGATAAAIAIRLAGVKGDLGDAKLLVAGLSAEAKQARNEAAEALDEARQLRARARVLEQQRNAELEELQSIAARCADAGEVRRWLQKLVKP